MARTKIVFTEEQNFRIAQMVEINKSLKEIVLDLERNFNIKVSENTLHTHIKTLGLNRIDGRKYSGNHSRGYAAEIEGTDKRALSKYKLKKMECGDMMSPEQAKKLGYDKNGLPLNYRLVKDKTGEIVEVELNITTDHIKWAGGDECIKGSERWWNIERMKFDMGCKGRPILEGQITGDWRGVVNRFNYDENGYYRVFYVDIIKEQQEAWERYVDAASKELTAPEKKKTNRDVNMSNHFIISNFSDSQMIDMMSRAPEMIYKYIPTHLYAKVVCYCLDKMYEDRRVKTEHLNIINTLKNIVSKFKMKPNVEELEKINMNVIKQTLFLNPNDYDLVIRYCCLYAMNLEMVDRNYCGTLFDILTKLTFNCVDTKDTLNGLDWLAVIGDHKDDFRKTLERRDKEMREFCEENGLVW